jgi:hypothetical protein
MIRKTGLLALAGILAIGLAFPEEAAAQRQDGIGGFAAAENGGDTGGGGDDRGQTAGQEGGQDDGRDGGRDEDDRGDGGSGSGESGGGGIGGASGPTDLADDTREVIYVRGTWSCPPVSTNESGSGICGLDLTSQEAICNSAGGGPSTSPDGGFTCTID